MLTIMPSHTNLLTSANTIWLPSKNQWALIDFGCACRTACLAELSFSLYYAPPEAIAAYRRGEHTIVAQPAADVWSLGVRAVLHLCVYAAELAPRCE